MRSQALRGLNESVLVAAKHNPNPGCQEVARGVGLLLGDIWKRG